MTASPLEKCREYGKAGDLTGDDREHVEVSALALHLTQAAIVAGRRCGFDRDLTSPSA